MIPKKGNGIAMLQDRIAELEAEVERLQKKFDSLSGHHVRTEAEVEITKGFHDVAIAERDHERHLALKFEREVERLKGEKCQENLRIYGIHNEDCELGMAILEDYGIGEADCTCGLDAMKGGE